MKLFHYLNTTNLPCQNNPFVQSLLKRLSIMEALATIKFKHSPVEDCNRELIIMTHLQNRCQIASYSIEKTEIILNFFSENMRLAKCIQTACFHEWGMMADETIKNRGLILARTIISNQLSSHTLLQSLREYVNDATNVLFDMLELIKETPELNELIEPLIICFPRVNERDLGRRIANIMESMTKLTSLPT